MFGLFRRHERVRALKITAPAVAATTSDRLVMFLRRYARPVDRAAMDDMLRQLAAHPPEWVTSLSALNAPGSGVATAQTPQPFTAPPTDPPALPPSAAGPEPTPGGPIW